MDLFTPVVPESAWHPNFASLVRRRNTWNEKVLADWAAGFVDRDNKFVREFQTSFNPCFWELYLHAVLKEFRLPVSFATPSPDFSVTGANAFSLEATIASNAAEDPSEHNRPADIPQDLNELNRQAIIRLSNAIVGKHRKYQAHYSRLEHVRGKPFVLAVAPFDRPYFHIVSQRAIEAVLHEYYVDEDAYYAAGDFQAELRGTRLTSIKKNNGSDIKLGLFSTPEFADISAVIFSTCATTGKVRALCADPNPHIQFTSLRLNPSSPMPHVAQQWKADYSETLLDGLRIYHNPHAANPLDPAVFRRPEVFQSYMDTAGEWVYEQREGQLLSRFVFTFGEKVASSSSPDARSDTLDAR